MSEGRFVLRTGWKSITLCQASLTSPHIWIIWLVYTKGHLEVKLRPRKLSEFNCTNPSIVRYPHITHQNTHHQIIHIIYIKIYTVYTYIYISHSHTYLATYPQLGLPHVLEEAVRLCGCSPPQGGAAVISGVGLPQNQTRMLSMHFIAGSARLLSAKKCLSSVLSICLIRCVST